MLFLKILFFAFSQPQYVLIMFFLKISYIFSLMFLYKGSYRKYCIKVEPFANCHQLVTENLFAVPGPFQLRLPPPPPYLPSHHHYQTLCDKKRPVWIGLINIRDFQLINTRRFLELMEKV